MQPSDGVVDNSERANSAPWRTAVRGREE